MDLQQHLKITWCTCMIIIKVCAFTLFYYMASSVSGQDEPNRVLWLATRAGKIELCCPLATTCRIPPEKFPQKPCNEFFIDQVCSQDGLITHMHLTLAYSPDKKESQEKSSRLFLYMVPRQQPFFTFRHLLHLQAFCTEPLPNIHMYSTSGMNWEIP